MPRVREILTEEDKKRKKAEWNRRYYEKNREKLIDHQLKLYRERKGCDGHKVSDMSIFEKMEILKQQQLELNKLLKQLLQDFESGSINL